MFNKILKVGHKEQNFEKITILVTAYIRRNYLPKLLNFLNVPRLKVILLDSSPTRWELADNYNWIDYKFSPNKLLYKVMYEASRDCSTPYILWLADDDILDLRGLSKCIDFIDQNKEFSSVTGRIKMRFSSYTVKEYKTWIQKYNQPSDNALSRLEKIFNCFVSGPHDVMQTKCMEKSFEIIVNNPDYYPVKFFDRVIALVQAIYGDKKLLDCTLIRRRKTSLLNTADYPVILQKNVKAEKFLDVIYENDPFSELISDLYGGETNYFHNYISKILENYFDCKK